MQKTEVKILNGWQTFQSNFNARQFSLYRFFRPLSEISPKIVIFQTSAIWLNKMEEFYFNVFQKHFLLKHTQHWIQS